MWKNICIWIGGTVTLFVVGYTAALYNEIALPPRELLCNSQSFFAAPAPNTHYTILVSDFDNDTDLKHTERAVSVFLKQSGVEVIRTCKVLKLETYKYSLSDAQLRAEKQGIQWLKDRNADLLIWGNVVNPDKEVKLSFLHTSGGSTIHDGLVILTFVIITIPPIKISNAIPRISSNGFSVV